MRVSNHAGRQYEKSPSDGRRYGGGVGGAIVGGITDDRRSQFNTYVVKERRSSYKYDRDVVVGAELPSSGVTYYEVPSEYGVKNYRYTVVNNRTVLVDPHSHRIVQIIE